MSTPNSSTQGSSSMQVDQTDASNTDNQNESVQTEANAASKPFEKPKRKKTSQVWADLKEVTPPNGTKKVQCIHCGQKLAFFMSGTTASYNMYLKSCVQKKLKENEGQQTITLTTIVGQTESIGQVQNFKYEHLRLREVIAHFLMICELSFSLVEHEMFTMIINTATPYYQKITRTTARNDCFQAYEIERERILNFLRSVDRVSITTDLWKSNQKISYMVVTCHFVDSYWDIQKRNLSFLDVPPPHSGLVIFDVLHKCLVGWKIDSKVWTISFDNAAYNDVAVRSLKDAINRKQTLPLDRKLFHVRCCAHILNLLVQDGLNEIQDVIANVRESVKFLAASKSRLKLFSDIANQLSLPKKKLILDCSTRWNSTYSILSTALEFKEVFFRYKDRDTSYSYLPSEDDWEKARKVCMFLEDFNTITILISGSKYTTANLFLSELCKVKISLNEVCLSEDIFFKAMREKMKKKFDKYWGECNLLIFIAAVLDPRFKMKFVYWCFPQIYSPTDSELHIQTVQESLRKLYDFYVQIFKASHSLRETSDVVSNSSFLSGSSSSQKKDFFSQRFVTYLKTVEPIIDSQKSEVDVYLEEWVHMYSEGNFDVLKWWKSHNLKFRILSKLARDVL